MLATIEHAGDTKGHAAQGLGFGGELADRDRLAIIRRRCRTNHLNQQLDAGEVTFRAAALKRKLGGDLRPAIAFRADQAVVRQERVVEQFSIAAMVSKMQDLYAQTVADHRLAYSFTTELKKAKKE